MILFSCDVCGQQLYFESSRCTSCQSALGYVAGQQTLTALESLHVTGAPPQQVFRALAPRLRGGHFRYCGNAARGACNWLVSTESDALYCQSCALSEIIPELSDDGRRKSWMELEAAKRRLLFTLLELSLPVASKAADPERGLSFRFLKGSDAAPVTTGHAGGVITINIDEADAAYRERERERVGEAYRTTLGHLRHEIGHYYFDRLIAGTSKLETFRRSFGDERADYREALSRHYDQGPPPDFSETFISGYASSHPWEDWAETWAHYLHMVDTLETARSYGIGVSIPRGGVGSLGTDHVEAQRIDFRDFDALMQAWMPISLALNDLNRSMGQKDAYPFAVSPGVRDKLAFVHRVIRER